MQRRVDQFHLKYLLFVPVFILSLVALAACASTPSATPTPTEVAAPTAPAAAASPTTAAPSPAAETPTEVASPTAAETPTTAAASPTVAAASPTTAAETPTTAAAAATPTTAAAGGQTVPGGDASAAPAAIAKYGCGTCHTIPGIAGANGKVGPSLAGFANSPKIAGAVANTPDNLVKWIENPPAVKPGTTMPNLSVAPADAANIAAFLYTLK